MSEAGNWCLIESDPAVFTELIQKFGVEGVQLEEIYGLDKEAFYDLPTIHGLIFLFKYEKNESGKKRAADVRTPPSSLFFAKQVINNACATQAILSVLLNTVHDDVKLGSTLSEFKTFTADFDPNLKGLALSNCDVIRNVHNSFAKQTLYEIDHTAAPKDEDIFHFISYIPHGGRLYELDGLQDGPIDLGGIKEGEDWLNKVRPVIKERMQQYQTGEIHFNLMALTSDRRDYLQKKIDACMKVEPTPEDEIESLSEALNHEVNKRAMWKIENVRRRHNYLPLIVNILKMLGDKQALLPLYQEAKQNAKDRKAASASKKSTS